MFKSYTSLFSMCETASMEKLLDQVFGKICFTRIFYFERNINFNGKFFHKDFYTSLKQTVNPSNFENKLLTSQ